MLEYLALDAARNRKLEAMSIPGRGAMDSRLYFPRATPDQLASCSICGTRPDLARRGET